MKTLDNIIKNKKLLFIFLCFFSLISSMGAWASMSNCTRPYAMEVESIKGTVLIEDQGVSYYASKGASIKDLSEIITEEKSEIILKDNYDHRFHISSGSMLKVLNKTLVLKNGSMRVISFNQENEFEIQTSNSISTYTKADAILTMNIENGKTQILVLSGNLRFSNQTDRDQYSLVEGGSFSFIENSQNEGLPRKATPIGKDSYLKIASVFKNSELNVPHEKTTIGRGIASHSESLEITRFENYEPKNYQGGPGKIIYLKNKDKEKSHSELKKIYAEDIRMNKEIKRKNTPDPFSKSTHIPIKIFGIPGTNSAHSPKHKGINERIPASSLQVESMSETMKKGLKSRWVKQVPMKDSLQSLSKPQEKHKSKAKSDIKEESHQKTNSEDYLKTERNNLEAKKIIQELNSH